MAIKLDRNYCIDADKLQWILLKDSRPYWFFTDLESLLRSYAELKMRSSKAKEVEQLIYSQKKIVEGLLQALNKVSEKDLNVNLPIRKEVEEK